MSEKDPDRQRRAHLLSSALKAVRAIRKATSRELARALGLSVRGYQNFEAGGNQVNFDHVMRVSAALDCDPFGVLVAMQIGRPEFAAHVAGNKAMLALLIALQEFSEDAGEAIAALETTTFVSAYNEMFAELARKARLAQAERDAWLAQNARRLGMRSDQAGEEDPS